MSGPEPTAVHPDGEEPPRIVARVTLAVGWIRVSAETRDNAAPAQLRLGRLPLRRVDHSLGPTLPQQVGSVAVMQSQVDERAPRSE